MFALVGSSEKEREKVVQQFSRRISAAGVIFSMPPGYDKQQRLPLLQRMFKPSAAVMRLLLLNNLQSIDEFNWVRSVGGYVVHVDGRPSDVVPMQQHDFFVSSDKNGRGRFDCVEDCFAAIKLRYKQDAQRRAAAKAAV